MIIEAAAVAAMYFSNQALGAEATDVPQMVPALTCTYRDPKRLRACLDRKMQNTPDPYQDMWDPNWISSITYRPEDVVNDSAKAEVKVLPKSHKEK